MNNDRVILAFVALCALMMLIALAQIFIDGQVDTERMRICLEAYTTDTGPIQPAFDQCMNQ